MELSYEEAVTYMRAPKQLVTVQRQPGEPTGWTHKPNQERRYPVAFFEARLRIEQTMPRGLKFRVSVFSAHPNSATFQMELDRPNDRRCLPLYRLEWRAVSGHGNGMGEHLPDDLRGVISPPGQTHEHSCLDHVTLDRLRIMSGGVHAARSVDPDPQTYDDALRYACAKLSIENPEVVPGSGVQWSLV